MRHHRDRRLLDGQQVTTNGSHAFRQGRAAGAGLQSGLAAGPAREATRLWTLACDMPDPRAMQAQLEEQRRRVDVDNYTITVRELLTMAENGELHRAPEYQRKFRWDEESESRLVESVLLGLPVPNLFFATNSDGSWEVVDGLQRLSTLIHFALENAEQIREIGKQSALRLTGLRNLTEFNDLTFAQLPTPVQLSFTKRGFGVTALSDKSDPATRFDTFERLNRGAVALTAQEVRACIYKGGLNDLLRELAANETFIRLVKLQTQNEVNATREELVLKFFAYRYGRDQFKGGVKDFLNDWMQENNAADLDKLRKEFLSVVEAVGAVVNGPFLRASTSITPQNEFEGVMVAAAEVLAEQGRLGTPTSGWLDDPMLVLASTGATNTRGKLRDRIERAKVLLSP